VQRVLVISNGIGEDSIGAEIVRRLPRSLVAEAYPTLGEGQAYGGVCPIVGPRARLASEGSRVDRGTLRRDIAAGGLGTIPPALKFLRAARSTYDSFLVVGDFIGVAACWLAGVRDIVYIDAYNTGYGRRYHLAEKLVMRRVCRTVFCRSPKLADQLRPLGIDARATGNIMMDTVAAGDYDAARRRLRLKAVTLLPGSRETTVGNFALQIDALALLPEESRPDIFVAVADGIDPADLARATNLFPHVPQGRERSDLGRLSGRGLHVHLARGALKPLVEASDLVLSQAGTATVQALGLGRPVITFARQTDRLQRFVDENRLFGEARIIVPADAQRIAAEVQRLLGDEAERKRLGELGKARVGGPGVIDDIIAALGAPHAPAPTAGVTTST
jgi:uncharacterized protein (TIGR03492 family)